MDSYKNLLIYVSKRPRLAIFLRLADFAVVLITVFAYAASLVFVGLSDLYLAVRLAVICGVPFTLVSCVRLLIDAPRPYELYGDIYVTPPKRREGCSFPSRHAFSIFAIGTELAFIYPAAAVGILLLGVLLSLSRVLLGKHFIRDVVTGALVGAVTSIIGMIIMI